MSTTDLTPVSLDDGISFVDGMEIYQAQLDSLDLGFLDDIPVADGLFHFLPLKDEKLFSDVDSDDDSTVNLTDSSHCSRSNEEDLTLLDDSTYDDGSSLHSPSSDEGGGVDYGADDVENGSSQLPEHSNPRLATDLRDSFSLSLELFQIQETDATKERIKVAALRAKIRQQKHRNIVLAEKLEQSIERERDLMVAMHQVKSSAADDFQRCLIKANGDEGGIQLYIDGMREQKQVVDFKRQRLVKEAADIRRILESNAKRLETLRKERNEQATQRLDLELFMVHTGVVDPVEQLIVSETALRAERNELRDKLLDLSAEGRESLEDKEESESMVPQKNERIEILVKLSDKVLELQNDKYDVSEGISNLRHQLGQLKVTKSKQQANIKALEQNFLALTEDELHLLDEVAERAKKPPKRRRLISRFFGRKR
mmetsp:Transcript_5492/g.9063  ORF Transcript_5492/g.9063 Transcript_5492/m.9063 type:complete len:427 (+) Transcript_5492:191-1471(+)